VLATLRSHWRELLAEAALLGLFMLSACTFGVLLEHPASPLRAALPDALARRALMGTAMGLTAIALIYSPWGKRSGAHINPAVTLAFLRLGRLARPQALLYLAAQFVGAVAGVFLAWGLWGAALADPATNFVVTRPGEAGPWVAFAAEGAISFVLMSVVLLVSGSRLAALTGVCAGALVALYITFEAPLSGMSMNPARSFGSAVAARHLEALWLYFVAPPVGMVAAASLLRGRVGGCAKLRHVDDVRCVFCHQGGVPHERI
jgi:aquaporin Z